MESTCVDANLLQGCVALCAKARRPEWVSVKVSLYIRWGQRYRRWLNVVLSCCAGWSVDSRGRDCQKVGRAVLAGIGCGKGCQADLRPQRLRHGHGCGMAPRRSMGISIAAGRGRIQRMVRLHLHLHVQDRHAAGLRICGHQVECLPVPCMVLLGCLLLG